MCGEPLVANPVPPSTNQSLPGQLAAGSVLEHLPDGIALVREDDTIIWSNGLLAAWCGKPDLRGLNFFEALNRPEMLGPDASPFRVAITTGRTTTATLRTADNRYYHLQAAAERAIRSVYAAAPFRNLPREYYGVRIGVNFNAREACL